MTTTDVFISENGTSLFQGSVDGYLNTSIYNGNLSLKAGDILDFAVEYGSNHSNLFDSTGLDATLTFNGSGQTNTSAITVQVGYADNLRANPYFPSPWQGSPNTTFVGDTGTQDSGAILITNNITSAITVNDVSVNVAGVVFDLWGADVIPAGGNLILAQTNGENFDTSDEPHGGYNGGALPFPQTYPDGDVTDAAQVNITVNGVLLPTYLDTGHVLTTGGSDLADQGANESQNWRPIGTTGISNPGGAAVSVVVTHNLPASGYNVDPTTISPTPTSSSSSLDVWNARLLAGSNPSQFQPHGDSQQHGTR